MRRTHNWQAYISLAIDVVSRYMYCPTVHQFAVHQANLGSCWCQSCVNVVLIKVRLVPCHISIWCQCRNCLMQFLCLSCFNFLAYFHAALSETFRIFPVVPCHCVIVNGGGLKVDAIEICVGTRVVPPATVPVHSARA